MDAYSTHWRVAESAEQGSFPTVTARNEFTDDTAPLRGADGRFVPMPVEGRLWPKVEHDPPSGCWIWRGYVNNHGYGRVKVAGRFRLVHRVVWEIERGAIPEGGLVLHHCDRPRCVNPAHLFLGDHRTNSLDMVAKGRHRQGARRLIRQVAS